MSVHLRVQLVYGFHDPSGTSFGLGRTALDGNLVWAVSPVASMGGDGVLVYIRESVKPLLGDRDGYEFHSGQVVPVGQDPVREELYRELALHLKAAFPLQEKRRARAMWLVHLDLG